MPDTFTSVLNMVMPEIDGSPETWGQKLNADLQLLDSHAGTVNAHIAADNNNIQFIINSNFPTGVIMMWYGLPTAVPAGWWLCDGTHGTPNLTGRFVMGVGDGRPVGQAGGDFQHNHVTDTQGHHEHFLTTAPTTLTEAQMPYHTHDGWTSNEGWHDHTYMTTLETTGKAVAAGPNYQFATNITQNTGGAGTHAHFTYNDYRGGNQPHSHGLYGDGSHAHNVNITVVPPYYVLCYIMRA